ncbi:FeoA family protein [Membranihabitans marinus]|uniref:FeoA family protein n=1 Tax=Membranihabitans marinus TaxID=1227546 RepID=UPI00336CAAC0
MAIIDLSQLKTYTPALIHQIHNSFCEVRLLELGFLPGKKIEVIRKSPFGHTFYIKTNSGCFALRKNEASSIQVKCI